MIRRSEIIYIGSATADNRNPKHTPLLSITTVPSAPFSKNSKYYNSTDKLIYTATQDDTWNGAKTSEPVFGTIYEFSDNNVMKYYIWDGDNMVETDLEKYELLANKVNNIEANKTSIVKYPTVKSVYDFVKNQGIARNFDEVGITKTTHNDTILELAREIQSKKLTTGTILFGEIRNSDMPFNGNAEVRIEVLETKGAPNYYQVIEFTLYSTNVAPNEWKYLYYGAEHQDPNDDINPITWIPSLKPTDNYNTDSVNTYPSSKALSDGLTLKQDISNLSQDYNETSTTKYPSSKALSDAQKVNVKSVNFKTPDTNGNVLITQVATAENLVSPDNINDTAYILFRTAGGTKSISDGPATLMKIAGNVVNPRRSPNDIDTEHSESQRVTATVDATLFGALSFVNNTSGTYTLSCNNVNDTPTWQYDDNSTLINVDLEVAGIILSSTAFVGDIMEIVYNYSDVEGEESYAVATYNEVYRLTIAVDETTFAQKVNETFGVYTFLRQGSIWMINDSTVNISEYGITVTGTAQTGDTITVTYNGDMQVATPTSFQASGFNQFNPANVLSDYTINENGEIAPQTGSYVAFIHAVGGLENNYGNRHGDYTIYDDNTTGTLVRIGYSATIPTTSSTITLSGSDGIEVVNDVSILPANKLQWITFPKDGYICVALTDITKLCVHPTWSNYKDQDYAEYVAPSVINIPTTGYDISDPTQTQVSLNCVNYFGRVGNVFDEIFLEDNRYVNRIGRYAYSAENLATVEELGVDYIYDSNYIYYVLPTPVTYVVDIPDNGKYTVNDFGTEEFVGTTVAVLANTLYGNNLVDKLRTDVLTKSAQSLSQEQKEQVWDNLGLQPIYNHVNTLEPNATVTINLVSTKQVYELTPTSKTTLEFNTANLTEFNAQDSDVEIEFTLYIKMVDAQQAWEITFPDTVVWGNTSQTMTAMANYKFSFCKPKGSNIWIGNQMYSWVE